MTTQFKVGQTYSCRSLGDWDCIFSFEVVDRSEKTVTIKSHRGVVRRKIRVYDNVEKIDPLGRYSLSPTLSADRAP